jgi:serine/threonine-protein phosphatase CPPED1
MFRSGPAMECEVSGNQFRKTGLLFLLLTLSLAVAATRNETAKESFTFVQIADTQLGNGGYEHDLNLFRKAVERINLLKPDFVLFCGDFVDDFDVKSITDFNETKSKLAVPSYLTPGNHELYYQPSAASLNRYRALFGKDYFSFRNKGYTFIMADSQLWKSPLKGETEKFDAWFKEALKSAKDVNSPVFLVQHIPLYLKQPDEPEDPDYNLAPAKRKELFVLMEEYGVVAVLGGHTHKTTINGYNGIQLVNSGSLTKNDDNSPPGFMIWRVESPKSIKHEFVPLE